jgi:hypothetical protein
MKRKYVVLGCSVLLGVLVLALVAEPALAKDGIQGAGKKLGDQLGGAAKAIVPAVGGTWAIAAIIQRSIPLGMMIGVTTLIASMLLWGGDTIGKFGDNIVTTLFG